MELSLNETRHLLFVGWNGSNLMNKKILSHTLASKITELHLLEFYTAVKNVREEIFNKVCIELENLFQEVIREPVEHKEFQ